MIFEQVYLGCLSQASYFVADEKSGVAAIVDPRRDVDVYVEMAEARGLRIEHVLLTHVHADFIAGHLELRDRCGATIHLGAQTEAEFDFAPMKDGGVLALGPEVELRFIETPGHTPESVCIALHDSAQEAEAPQLLFTGDTLFCGEVGRPDLLAAIGHSAEELAVMLYDSLRNKLGGLHDDVVVYPGHGAGSACGKNISKDAFCKLGQQRELNWALQPMSEEQFVARLTDDLPLAPAYFALDAKWNRLERENLPSVLKDSLNPLGASEFLARAQQGSQVLDTRRTAHFATGHLRGSYFVGLSGNYASWAGSVLDAGKPVLLVTDPGREEEAALRLSRIGFDVVEGYLEGGIEALGELGAPIDSFERAKAVPGHGATVIDVRENAERIGTPIEGSIALPLSEFARRGGEAIRERGLSADQPLTVICAGGYRSVIAVSLLRREGFTSCNDIIGGTDALSSTV